VPDWSNIEHKISASTGKIFKIKNAAGIGGGDTNQAYRIDGIFSDEGESVCFFIKLNHKNRLAMFEAEVDGLQEIDKAQAIRVPRVICSGVEENQSYLILENLPLARGHHDSARLLGQQLALMHKYTASDYGWFRDNTIGAIKQINTQTKNWMDFWREYRLGFQLNLANQNDAQRSLQIKGEKLLDNLENFFTGYQPQASLLHGDLWSGNFGYIEEGAPVIFDPAVYYGDREADLAMTELFGGFPAEFYTAYNEAWPLDKGYQQRKKLYNVYHILNHFNMFGGGYAMQAENILDQLLTQ
jgi:fructosamine-3-kinase